MAIGTHTRGWAQTLSSPDGADAASDLDILIQAITRDIGERFDEEHDLNIGTQDDGRHKAGSARTGHGTQANQPPNRTTTPQEGASQTTGGGNETGRLYRVTGGGADDGRLMFSDGTNWVDAVRRVVAATATTALTVETGNIDLVTGAKFSKDGASEMDIHSHRSRHRLTGSSGAWVSALDGIPFAIQQILTDINDAGGFGSSPNLGDAYPAFGVDQRASISVNFTGRTNDSRVLVIAQLTSDSTFGTTYPRLRIVMDDVSTVVGREGADVGTNATSLPGIAQAWSIGYKNDVTAAPHTFVVQGRQGQTGQTSHVYNCDLYLIDFGDTQ